MNASHTGDLELARRCAGGEEAAWERFVLEFRPVLYRAADALDPGGGARDLADSLYADLFGIGDHAGERQSLFRYFHGRSSLATWLRAVLAQRYVDRLRATRRTDPLPDDDVAIPGSAQAGRMIARLSEVIHDGAAVIEEHLPCGGTMEKYLTHLNLHRPGD